MKVSVTTSWTKVIPNKRRSWLSIQNNSSVAVEYSTQEPPNADADYGEILEARDSASNIPGGSISFSVLPKDNGAAAVAVWARASEAAFLNYNEV